MKQALTLSFLFCFALAPESLFSLTNEEAWGFFKEENCGNGFFKSGAFGSTSLVQIDIKKDCALLLGETAPTRAGAKVIHFIFATKTKSPPINIFSTTLHSERPLRNSMIFPVFFPYDAENSPKVYAVSTGFLLDFHNFGETQQATSVGISGVVDWKSLSLLKSSLRSLNNKPIRVYKQRVKLKLQTNFEGILHGTRAALEGEITLNYYAPDRNAEAEWKALVDRLVFSGIRK